MATVVEEEEHHSVERKMVPNGKKFHVFISYSESDRSWVGTVIQHLQNDYNFKCFENSADFIPGRKITENIEYAMSNSVKTMFILTEEYNKSYWCQYEVEFAILKLLAEMKENVIIPVLKEECEIPGYLRPFTYINGIGDMNVWLPKLALAIEAQGEQYNHELALNRVKDAVNRNRNLDLLHEETSRISCRGPVFRWKYVPESLSIPPMKVSSELYNEIIKTISSKRLVLGRHCRNCWWPTMLLALVIVLPTLGVGLAFIGIAINGGTSDLIEIISVLMAFPSVAMLWLAMCCCSEYWGQREMRHAFLEFNRRLIPNKVMVTYKRQRLTANFTICFLFFDMTSCVNHMASELLNKRIRENPTRDIVVLNMNDDDDEVLLDDTTEDSVTYNEQETVTNNLLDLSSAYLQDYTNEKLEHAGDNNRHATKAICICQFAESLEIKKNANL
ncbi:Hypothetical predicted protein [Mytilus galloprovincialis]|uniref:TIR domain-containing protein n=1 Tax=Mytilus galloprovincialis TaxID=29158 RepID=A0A8B6DVQ3_MYTGA|nr:Hypothetical predicted protein [Mytilus galloprovincialis]